MQYFIGTPSINAALTARDILAARGISAEIEKTTGETGCIYNIIFSGDLRPAISLLASSGVSVLDSGVWGDAE